MTAMNEKPEIDFPGGEAPADLVITDIVEGDGAEAKAGDVAHVHYVGVAFSTGEEFDSSWNRGAPLTFPLGAGHVIRGWDQGVQGMRVGGRRQLRRQQRMLRPRQTLQNAPGQRFDIFATLTQGRHAQFDDIEAVIEILAELATLDTLAQIAVGRAENAQIHRLLADLPHLAHFLFLNGTQQLDLHRQR